MLGSHILIKQCVKLWQKNDHLQKFQLSDIFYYKDDNFIVGLKDLSLSANPGITQKSWAKFGISVAASGNLRELYLDYNSLGDYAASCIVVGLSKSPNLRVLDLEGTNITDPTAEVSTFEITLMFFY